MGRAVAPHAPDSSLEGPTTPGDPNEATRVLASLFPKYLKTLGDCPKSRTQPATWVEIDDIELANLDNGRFVPVIERRERGHYTDSSEQVRYVIRIDNCQPNTEGPLRIEAVFSEWALASDPPVSARRPRPILLREWRGLRIDSNGAEKPTFHDEGHAQ